MKRSLCFYVGLVILLAFSGCQTATVRKNPANQKETLDAVGQVADALAGQSLTDEEKKKFIKDIRKDTEAQSALESISNAMNVQTSGVKYCPIDGKRYSSSFNNCPVHQVKLKDLDD